MSGGQWPGPGPGPADRDRARHPALAWPAAWPPWLQSGSTGQPRQPGLEYRDQGPDCSGGRGTRGQTRADGRGPDRTRPGPDTEIQPGQPAHNNTRTRAIKRLQSGHSLSLGEASLFGRNDGHFMIYRMCALSLSVPPPAPAAGLPPPPPGQAAARASQNYAVSSLQSPVPTRHIVPDRSLSLKKQTL